MNRKRGRPRNQPTPPTLEDAERLEAEATELRSEAAVHKMRLDNGSYTEKERPGRERRLHQLTSSADSLIRTAKRIRSALRWEEREREDRARMARWKAEQEEERQTLGLSR